VYREMVEVKGVAGLAAGLVDDTAESDHHTFPLTLEAPRLPQEHAARTASHLRQQPGGGDLEIEWAWDGEQIQVIQARPLTVAPPAPHFSIGSSQRPVLRVSPFYGGTPPERGRFCLGPLEKSAQRAGRHLCSQPRSERPRLASVARDP
jgi:hypothetical protein